MKPAAAPSPEGSMKRKKTEDDDDSSGANKKSRTRVSYSCGECHRRKQKCDRQIPCSHCVARKVPELCKAYTPGKPDQDIHLRLARLEHIIETALPQYASTLNGLSPLSSIRDHQRSRSPSQADDGHSNSPEQDPHGGSFQSGRWYGNSASGSVAPASVLEQLQQVVSTPDAGGRGRSMSNANGNLLYPDTLDGKAIVAANSIIDSVRQDSEPTAADNLKTLIQDCGVSPHKITELVQELPPQRFMGVLVDYYFDTVNWTRYPISERDFRQSYASLVENGVAAHPNDVRFLPLLFVVLAIAVRLAPENIAGDARSRRLTSLRYYWASRRSVLIAAAIQPDSLDMVLTRLLSARFLTFDRRITEVWSQLGAAVRTAQALGLHRDGADMGMEPAQVEYRRRIWAYLYHADRSYALVLGRPNAIQDAYTSTKPPSNVEDEISLSDIRNPPPLTTPTRMSFVILRHTLAEIIGRIVHHFQQVRQHSHYSEVLALDDELIKFVHALPPHFSLQPDTSMDETIPCIPSHRFLLITEVLFVRISLHRPYLLRRLTSDRYLRSRKACFESAQKDFEIRQAFRKTVSNDLADSLHSAYREFQGAMISGIYLVLEPRGRQAETMHAILDFFLKEHEGLREMDETTRRELKIIEFLKMKASQAEEEAGTNGIPHENGSKGPLGFSIGSPSYPSLHVNTSTVSPRMAADVTSPKAATFYQQQPAIQRIQQQSAPSEGHETSKSGSPSMDDESGAAQNLLDAWYNSVSSGAVSGGPGVGGSGVDGVTGLVGLPWGGQGFGNSDLTGWFGPTATAPGVDPTAMPMLDGSDWNYWENLVNEIRGGPPP
ncbi:uncharacterized protein STEHIDRAFT_95677 [Stereum hirsutum FP-91666 SS1]|uniref:uncharacterized protein n=1 Tax=Stereum hirsutum (strain FP-91666) TaxID=721885 RepID=UPI000440B0BA|nr:uncharacterized protein STEHIDRAFT_95677 [Stereum hirsutum FP-91666 SS1]EIM88461.1 hypothetical protein STEHIDRAFT_95677 [Stereum hirsutum FP-91666 SS1]